ncbi:MAG: hypothetical protein M1832_001040 [Thelocarpon impressellum]|nr:MAG: hypothetical protein M1832_001040 [Thelocarpon impressellum]
METFVSRKRRRLSPPPDRPRKPRFDDVKAVEPSVEEDSTEVKLAVLASLHPYVEQSVLLDLLLANEGSVEATSQGLSNPRDEQSPRKRSTVASLAYQSSISRFASQQSVNASKAKRLTKKGRTLHLYSPEDVATHTPCSIIHNFLRPDEADALLEELLEEVPSFDRATFKLFDNVVQSPHTACFYVQSVEDQEKQKTEYLYNGSYLTDIRQITPHMRRISPKVQDAVNGAVATRIKHYPGGKKLRHQSPKAWIPNAAFVNCYDGGEESVGYHSDQLTYLGPRAIIGSLSLGVTREFRVRRIVPREDSPSTSTPIDSEGQIAIHLPHNSLLVMHAEMQEEWKHAIAPAPAIDPHPIAGRRRINITYRDYRESFHPRYTPRCACGLATVLRVVQRKRENWGRYFWICHVGATPGKEGCTFFQWAEFDDDGEPKDIKVEEKRRDETQQQQQRK